MENEFYKRLIQDSAFGYAHHRIILDESNEPIDYEFIEVNLEFERLTGLKSKNILNKRVTEVIPGIHKDKFDWIRFYGEIALKGGKREFESYSEQLEKWYKVDAFSYEKYYFVTFFTDITDRMELKKAKEEIKFQENLLECVGEAVIATDLDGYIKYWNRAAENIYGWKIEEAMGSKLVNLISLDKEEEVLNRIRNRNLWKGEYFLKRKDGTIFPASVTGSPIIDKNGIIIGRIGVSKDITNKKIAEERLIEINKKLEEANRELKIKSYVVDQSPSSIVITDKNGTIEYVNPNFTKLTEYTKEEAIGNNPRVLKSGYHSTQFYENMWRTILLGETWSGEILNRNKSGKLYWEYALISGIKDENGEIQHFVAVKDNITELKKAHEEIIRAKKEADSANNAKSIFLANISHEIRTPINSIIGFSELLDRDNTLSKLQREYNDIIIKSGEHLLELINSILEISKIESGKLYFNVKNFDIYETFDSIYKMFKERCHIKNIELIFEKNENILRYVAMDESKVKQIFINIIGNAVKFTTNGKISVKLEGYMGAENKKYLKAEIEDSGPGISKEEIGKLFKFFEQTSSGITKGSGTGIGLAISKKLIEMMGGGITVSSEIGKGTIFRFEIELKEGEKGKIEKNIDERIISVYNKSGSYKILVVEDNYINLFGTVELLKMVGFETSEAENGKIAIEKIENYKPDLVLMDLRMPIMDGYETIKIIKEKENTKNIPIIIMTADVFEDIGNRFKEFGADEYLIKPFREYELFSKIKKLLKITYIYENKNKLKDYNDNKIEEEIDSSIKRIPEELLTKLKNAAKAADLELLLEIIDIIGKNNEKLAETLKKYAINYEYEKIEKI